MKAKIEEKLQRVMRVHGKSFKRKSSSLVQENVYTKRKGIELKIKK